MINAVTSAIATAIVAPLGPTAPSLSVCTLEPDPPVYYSIELVTTRNIPATGRAVGKGDVTFAASPYGVALSPDGSYLYDVRVKLGNMRTPDGGTLVAWATTTQVDRIVRLGALDEDLTTSGRVAWNKFLLVVTLEPADDEDARAWSGPIVMRGMSRSGMMHTMAGHGPFQQELCARYGYN